MKAGYCAARAMIAATVIIAASIPALNAQTSPIVVKLATPTLNDGQHEWLKRFAAAIQKKSNGRMTGEIYAAGQLGTIPRMIESTQLGSIQLFVAPPEFFVGVDQRFELLSAAGLVESEQQAVKVISDQEFAKAFLALGANKGLIGVNLFIVGPSAFAMRMPLRTLADFKGKKIRVLASPFQMNQIAKLGGTGVPLSLGDVLTALQQGTIDGALGTLGVFTALKYYDTAKLGNETGHAFAFSLAVVSKKWFDVLPDDLKTVLLSAAAEIGPEIDAWQIDFIDRQRKIWVENGGKLDMLSPADKAEMMSKIGMVGDDIVKTKPELQSLWKLLHAAAKRNL